MASFVFFKMGKALLSRALREIKKLLCVQSLILYYIKQIDSMLPCICPVIGTLRYEDGKARTATAVDAGNLRGSRRVARNKILKMCTFAKDGDVNNLNFT